MKLEPWQQLVLQALHELSDASFQARAWLRREGQKRSSPGETVNQLFDDSGLGDLLEDGPVFSESADAKLNQLSAYVDTINFERSIEDLLADEAWPVVRQLALEARTEVNTALGSQGR